jgi:biotin operon repressor
VIEKPPFEHPDANCRGVNTNLFFPEQGEPHDQIRKALDCCKECPARVRQACLEHALTYNEPGIWGGTTARQRRHMKRTGSVLPPARRQAAPVRRKRDETRNDILRVLRGGGWVPMNVLVDSVGITRQSVYRALQRLRDDGVVVHRQGHYSLVEVNA